MVLSSHAAFRGLLLALFLLVPAALAQPSDEPPSDYAEGCESRGGTVYRHDSSGWGCRPPAGSCGDGTDPYEKDGQWMCTGDTPYMWEGQQCPEGMTAATTPEGNRTCRFMCKDGSEAERLEDGTFRCTSGFANQPSAPSSDSPPASSCPDGGEWWKTPDGSWACPPPPGSCPGGADPKQATNGNWYCDAEPGSCADGSDPVVHPEHGGSSCGDGTMPPGEHQTPPCPDGSASAPAENGAYRCPGGEEWRPSPDGDYDYHLYCGERPCGDGEGPSPTTGSSPMCPDGREATRDDDGTWRCGEGEFREQPDGSLVLTCGEANCTPEDLGMANPDLPGHLENAGEEGAAAPTAATAQAEEDISAAGGENTVPTQVTGLLGALALAALAVAPRRKA